MYYSWTVCDDNVMIQVTIKKIKLRISDKFKVTNILFII